VIDTAKLKEKILDLAIRGKLVPQDPNDEPASVLLEKIRAEKLQMVKEGKLKQKDIKDDTVIFVGEDNLHYEKFGDGSIKCIEDEIPFEIPKSWAWCRLRDVFNVGSSKRVLQSDWKKEGIPFYRAREIVKLSDFGLVNNDLFISECHYNELKTNYGIPKFGDLMVTGVGTIGKVYIVKENDKFYYKDASVLCFANDYHAINSDFAKLLLESSFLQKQIHGQTYGNTVDTITISTANNYLFLLPPIKEQNLIVATIKKYTTYLKTLNESKENLIESIVSLKAKILDLAIRGKLVPQDPNDEPADILLEHIRKEKEELIKQGKIKRDKKESIIFKGDDNSYYEQFEKNTEKFDEEIPFSIPDSWQWARLGSYTQKITDYVASGSFASLRENVPVLKNKDYAIMVKTADFSNNFTQNLTYTTEHGYNYLENSNLFGGELILSNIGSIGKVFIVPKLNQKMTLAPNTVMIKLLNEEHRDYVYNFLLSPFGYAQLLKISGGTGIAKFNKTDLKTLLLPIPPIQEQDRIIKQINNLFDLLSEVENSIK